MGVKGLGALDSLAYHALFYKLRTSILTTGEDLDSKVIFCSDTGVDIGFFKSFFMGK